MTRRKEARKTVDAAKAVQMHRDGMDVHTIAEAFGTQRPAIYRAFHSEGYSTPLMRRRQEQPSHYLPADYHPRRGHVRPTVKRDEVLPDPVYRDPCTRCGVRADIGCGCNKAPVGWRAG
jgi:hypothetical protein